MASVVWAALDASGLFICTIDSEYLVVVCMGHRASVATRRLDHGHALVVRAWSDAPRSARDVCALETSDGFRENVECLAMSCSHFREEEVLDVRDNDEARRTGLSRHSSEDTGWNEHAPEWEKACNWAASVGKEPGHVHIGYRRGGSSGKKAAQHAASITPKARIGGGG